MPMQEWNCMCAYSDVLQLMIADVSASESSSTFVVNISKHGYLRDYQASTLNYAPSLSTVALKNIFVNICEGLP